MFLNLNLRELKPSETPDKSRLAGYHLTLSAYLGVASKLNEMNQMNSPIQIDPEDPDEATLILAVQLLKADKLVAFPTETVYGLGANALSVSAVERIFLAKGRPSNNPLILHVHDVKSARSLVAEWTSEAQLLAEAFWPGPLTLVLKKAAHIPNIVTGGGATVALRIPANPIALKLLEMLQSPIAAPSANKSLGVSPTSAQHVQASLGSKVDLILDGGSTTGGIESTVLNLTVQPPRLLRPGLITADKIEAVIGKIDRLIFSQSEAGNVSEFSALLSPGTSLRHYSPNTPLRWGDAAFAINLATTGARVAYIHHSPAISESSLFFCTMPDEPKGYAAKLYSALHALDDGRFTQIVVEQLGEGELWDAIRDRLNRAAYSG